MEALAYGTSFVVLTAVSNVMAPTYSFAVDRITMRMRVACMALVYRKVGLIKFGCCHILDQLDDQSNSLTGSEVEPRKHK